MFSSPTITNNETHYSFSTNLFSGIHSLNAFDPLEHQGGSAMPADFDKLECSSLFFAIP
jgi:hypothetical protein